MHIQIPTIDNPSRMAGYDEAILDLDLDQPIGFIHTDHAAGSTGPRPGVSISLFGGKYRAHFQTHEECVAFAIGVQAVINHMVSTADQRRSAEA